MWCSAGGAPLQWRDLLLPQRRRATGVERPQRSVALRDPPWLIGEKKLFVRTIMQPLVRCTGCPEAQKYDLQIRMKRLNVALALAVAVHGTGCAYDGNDEQLWEN